VDFSFFCLLKSSFEGHMIFPDVPELFPEIGLFWTEKELWE